MVPPVPNRTSSRRVGQSSGVQTTYSTDVPVWIVTVYGPGRVGLVVSESVSPGSTVAEDNRPPTNPPAVTLATNGRVPSATFVTVRVSVPTGSGVAVAVGGGGVGVAVGVVVGGSGVGVAVGGWAVGVGDTGSGGGVTVGVAVGSSGVGVVVGVSAGASGVGVDVDVAGGGTGVWLGVDVAVGGSGVGVAVAVGVSAGASGVGVGEGVAVDGPDPGPPPAGGRATGAAGGGCGTAPGADSSATGGSVVGTTSVAFGVVAFGVVAFGVVVPAGGGSVLGGWAVLVGVAVDGSSSLACSVDASFSGGRSVVVPSAVAATGVGVGDTLPAPQPARRTASPARSAASSRRRGSDMSGVCYDETPRDKPARAVWWRGTSCRLFLMRRQPRRQRSTTWTVSVDSNRTADVGSGQSAAGEGPTTAPRDGALSLEPSMEPASSTHAETFLLLRRVVQCACLRPPLVPQRPPPPPTRGSSRSSRSG
jgi:hypothetical protein